MINREKKHFKERNNLRAEMLTETEKSNTLLSSQKFYEDKKGNISQ